MLQDLRVQGSFDDWQSSEKGSTSFLRLGEVRLVVWALFFRLGFVAFWFKAVGLFRVWACSLTLRALWL